MKILSVDDNSQNRYLIEAVGRAYGYEVISAGNGLTALEALEQQLPDLIVSDILMPEMDGFQFCHEVKTHERTRHLPFIIYTATYTAKQDEELAMSLGASRFIVKPMDPEQFMDVIEEVVEEARRGKAVLEVAPVDGWAMADRLVQPVNTTAAAGDHDNQTSSSQPIGWSVSRATLVTAAFITLPSSSRTL